MRWLTTILILSFLSFSLKGQEEPVKLYNPSFEGIAQCCQPPFGWSDCGFPNETPPDVQPSGAFEVNRPPFDGRTFLGMVVRDNDTWERVGQKLSDELESGTCYDFSVYLCRSPKYLSPTKADPLTREPYTTPVVLRIWGGNDVCNKAEMLAESPLIENTFWKKFNFRIKPAKTHNYIIFEAFYQTPTLLPYNGNVLVDNASHMQPVPCNEEKPPAIEDVPIPEEFQDEVIVNQRPPINQPEVQEEEEEPVYQPEVDKMENTPERIAEQELPEKVEPEKPFKPKILKELDRDDFKAGETIRIRNLYFDADTSNIDAVSYDVLDEIYAFLSSHTNVVVEIGGHTNGRPTHEYCDKLSTERAKAVAEYLNNKGIPWDRLHFKGYGKRQPIASDNTAYGRQKNQRVEIKILSVTG